MDYLLQRLIPIFNGNMKKFIKNVLSLQVEVRTYGRLIIGDSEEQ